VASNQEDPSGTLLIGAFGSVARAASIVARALDANIEAGALGLLMTDRTAERHLGPPNARNALDTAETYGAAFDRLAATLAPLAPLGAAGSGLVGAGALAAALVGAGLGSRAALDRTFMALGIDADYAREAARLVRDGAVLVSLRVTEREQQSRWATLLARESALTFRFATPRASRSSVVTRPAAPPGQQRATLEPVIESPDTATGSSAGANRLGS
jgi:hypothetical protein